MPNILKPKDPVAVARGKVFQKRFKPPEGTSGFTGSIIKSIVDWRESKSSLTHEQYVKKEIDKIISPMPSPLPTPVMTEETQAAKSRVRARKMGRRENILAGRRRMILGTGRMMGSPQILKTRLGE